MPHSRAESRRTRAVKPCGFACVVAVVVGAGFLQPASAQPATSAAPTAWPTKPIRIVIGFPPGGAADAVARPVAEALARDLAQPVIVDNKPGAGTTIAVSTVANAAPDGYTLFMGGAGHYGALNLMYRDFTIKADAFVPIARWSIAPMIVTVSNDLGVSTVPELIAMARAKPGQLNYASSGVGAAPHLTGLAFVRATGLDIVHVPYKGGAPALQGIVGGETQLTFGTPASVLPLAQAGRLKMIAVTSTKRSPMFPDLPTVAEGGVKDFDFTFWYGLFAPRGTDPAIIERLAQASRKALDDPGVREKLLASGNEAMPSDSPADFAAWAQNDGGRWADLLRASAPAAAK